MDDTRFDVVAKILGQGVTRRGSVRCLAAALAGAAGWSAAPLRARRRKRKPGGVAAQTAGKGVGKGQAKVTLCHWDEDAQRYDRITVARPGADAHLRQHDEDFAFPDNGECCNTSECEVRDCNSVACDEGRCVYSLADDDVGSACGEDDAGVCVRKASGSGKCAISNDGSRSCVGADPCGVEAGGVRECAADGSCRCYSTVEGAGLCLRFAPGFQYPASAVSCDEGLTREPCDDSAECPHGEACAPLDSLGTTAGICCGRGGNLGKRGFCVNVGADLCGVPA